MPCPSTGPKIFWADSNVFLCNKKLMHTNQILDFIRKLFIIFPLVFNQFIILFPEPSDSVSLLVVILGQGGNFPFVLGSQISEMKDRFGLLLFFFQQLFVFDLIFPPFLQ